MNIYAIIILIALVLSYALGLIANLLNLRALADDVPEEFRDVFDAESYRTSQRYTRERTRFGLWHSSFGIALTLAFWFAGGFQHLDVWVRSFELGSIWIGLVYIGVLVVARGILDLPFGVYSTFVIEARFGFNKTTPATFVGDRIKVLILGAALGGPLLAGLLLFFEHFGPGAWVYCWLFTTVFTLAVQLVLPTWILPLFNKFRPLEDSELRGRILDYAGSVSFPIENVFVVDGSRRSAKTNAFFTGFGKRKRLALFDTLVEKHSVAELVAIFAHEVGHSKRRHIFKGLVLSIAHTGLLFYLLSFFISSPALFDAFYMEYSRTEPAYYAGLVFFGLLYSPVELVLSMLMQQLSRKHEYEADHYAATTIENADDMASALKRLSRDNLINLTPHPFYVFLSYSHPPILDRIGAIRKAAALGVSH